MLIPLLLLAGLSLGKCEDVSSQIELSINRTIDTVEKIVNSNPSLPRLSRQDILHILQNITAGNPEFEKIQKTAKDAYQRSLMVVLPHSGNEAHNNLNELYTKSPLVQMIPDSKEADSLVEIGKTEEIVFPPNPKDPSPFTENAEKIVADSSSTPNTTNIKVECKTVSDVPQDKQTNFYSELQQNFSMVNNKVNSNESEPEKFTFNLSSLDQITKSAQEYMASTKWPNDNPNNKSNVEKVAIVYSTSVIPKSSDEKSTSPSNHALVYDSAANVLRSDQWHYMEPPAKDNGHAKIEHGTEKYIFLPTMPNLPGNVNTFFEIPRKVAGSYSNHDELDRPAPVYVTPVSSTSTKTMNIEQETTLNNNIPTSTGGFSIATKIETSVKPMDMVESVGVQMRKGESSKDQRSDVKVDKNLIDANYQDISGSRFNLPLNLAEFTLNSPNSKKLEPTLVTAYGSEKPMDNYQNIFNNKQLNIKGMDVKFNEPVGLTSFDFDSPSITKQNTFESPQSDFKKGVENLSPDVRLLFQRFGLQTSLKDIPTEKPKTITTTTTKRPSTTSSYLDSFTSFKRLPTSQVENKEMRDFLAQFGLGNYDSRRQKSMKSQDFVTQPPQPKPSTFDIRSALDNIGLLALVPRIDEGTVRPKPKPVPTKLHVFRPHESLSSSEEQKEKIQKLLSTVKMVQEGKVQDVQKVVSDLIQTTKSLKSGPDPVDLDEILKIYKDDMKTEKKKQRQAIFEEKEDEQTSSTTTTSTESTTSMEETSIETTAMETTVMETTSLETTSMETTESSTEKSTTAKGSIFDSLDLNIPAKPEDSDAKESIQPDNFAALEESFGGSTAAPDPVIPTRPRTGLYFLVDWNTFLEVGEDGKDKVNLRFQPKVGDRTRFIPIKIP